MIRSKAACFYKRFDKKEPFLLFFLFLKYVENLTYKTLIENRAYYVAHTNIDTLALLEETKGTNWLRCRTRQVPIRTISFIPCQIKIPLNQTTAVYQKPAPKIKELKALGMSIQEISLKLAINGKTVGKALKNVPLKP